MEAAALRMMTVEAVALRMKTVALRVKAAALKMRRASCGERGWISVVAVALE